MKIGILTHYNVNNQGAQIQMYAMKTWLEEQGHQVMVRAYEKDSMIATVRREIFNTYGFGNAG